MAVSALSLEIGLFSSLAVTPAFPTFLLISFFSVSSGDSDFDSLVAYRPVLLSTGLLPYGLVTYS